MATYETSKNLLRACWRGDVEMARKAIADGANVNHVENTETGNAVIHEAAFEGKTEIIKVLLESGANPNVHNIGGNTPLMLAARRGHLEAIKALVAGGADVNANDGTGGTAFSNARNYPEVQRLLRERTPQTETSKTRSLASNLKKPWWRFW